MKPTSRALMGVSMVVVSLTCAVGGAHAELVSASPAAAAPEFLTSAAASLADTLPDLSSASAADSLDGRKVALATRSLALPAAAAPSLWSFVTTVQAQQHGGALQQLGTQLKLAQQVTPLTQVPLPASLWLLVMGVLGLAGSRLGLARADGDKRDLSSPIPHPA